jgi:hypothetical protein
MVQGGLSLGRLLTVGLQQPELLLEDQVACLLLDVSYPASKYSEFAIFMTFAQIFVASTNIS